MQPPFRGKISPPQGIFYVREHRKVLPDGLTMRTSIVPEFEDTWIPSPRIRGHIGPVPEDSRTHKFRPCVAWGAVPETTTRTHCPISSRPRSPSPGLSDAKMGFCLRLNQKKIVLGRHKPSPSRFPNHFRFPVSNRSNRHYEILRFPSNRRFPCSPQNP